ncbi:MAG: hypothetical protein SAJ11_23620, partial [Jaaginema sp. PMC 1078.18]|nr:hypothetical protein [Jaaginema sp. PMC 1078.18]
EEEARQRAEALSVEARSPQFRRLLLQLPLDDDHRSSLQNRGLTDEQIKAGLFRTVISGQKVSDISPRLPGITADNRLVFGKFGTRGFLCPAFDSYGRITGCQVRLDNATGGKYRWLKSEFSSHLPNGELPLTVAYPVNRDPKTIERVVPIEGIGKPFFAAQIHGVIAIGASGGNFTSSKEQLKATLKQLSITNYQLPCQLPITNDQLPIEGGGLSENYDNLGVEGQLSKSYDNLVISFAPDAGGVSNKNVFKRDRKTIRLIQSWGYRVQVANWGQWYDKSRPDFDELSPDADIQWVDAEEYLKLPPGKPTSPFLDWFKHQLLSTSRRKGFGWLVQNKTPVQPPKTYDWKPGQPLPTPQDYADKAPPIITFPEGTRLQLIHQLQQLGWTLALDRSWMGLGKSHSLGMLQPDPETHNKIWYLDSNHRNPSTDIVRDNFTDLPPRHNGLYKDAQGHLKRATTPEQRDNLAVAANCFQADLFLDLKNKGYQPEGHSGELNPICQKCPLSGRCATERGDGFGFRFERAVALKERRIRAHIDSLPHPDDYNYNQDVAIVEEAGRLLQGTKTFKAKWADLLQQFDEVEDELPDVYPLISPLKKALRDILNGKVEQGNYGFNDAELRPHLPTPPEALNDLLEAILALQPNLADLIVEPDSVTGCGGQWRETGEFVRRYFRQQARTQTQASFSDLPHNALYQLLAVWGGLAQGALRVKGNQVTVTVRDTRHQDYLNAFGLVLLLDATPHRGYMAQVLGRDAHQIIEIEQVQPKLDNLTIYNTHIEGLGSMVRSEKGLARIAAYKQAWRDIDPNVQFIGIKGEPDIDGYWFNHNRGSNQFEGCSNLAIFGSPYANVGGLQDDYLALFGSLDGFEDWYRARVEAEIMQMVGRPRAHRYPDQEFVMDFVATGQDLSFLSERYGIKVINRQAFEFCPEAGTDKQISKWKIAQTARQFVRSGQRLVQRDIGQVVGLSQSHISSLVGDWLNFKKLFVDLYSQSNKNDNPEPDLLHHEGLRAWLELDPIEV